MKLKFIGLNQTRKLNLKDFVEFGNFEFRNFQKFEIFTFWTPKKPEYGGENKYRHVQNLVKFEIEIHRFKQATKVEFERFC